jgi:hypothetical protein
LVQDKSSPPNNYSLYDFFNWNQKPRPLVLRRGAVLAGMELQGQERHLRSCPFLLCMQKRRLTAVRSYWADSNMNGTTPIFCHRPGDMGTISPP